MKKRIKFTIKGLPDAKAIQQCKVLKDALDKDPAMKDAPEEFTNFGTKLATAEAKVVASEASGNASKDATGEKDAAMEDLRLAAADLIDYLQFLFKGDEQSITGVGLSTRKVPTPSPLPGVPLITSVMPGVNAGCLEVQWKRAAKAGHYEIEYCVDPVTEGGWKSWPTVTKTRVVLEGLVSGTRVSIRVRGANTKGQGGWSDPIARIVP